MSRMTKEINKITRTIISFSGKLIIYAVVLLLLFEGTTRGYEFGHEIFFATAVDQGEGTEMTVTIPRGQSAAETAHLLKQSGLIVNELAFQVQKYFYKYDIYPGTYQLSTAMTSKEILQLLAVDPEDGEGSESAPSSGAAAQTEAAASEAEDDNAEAVPESEQIGEGEIEIPVQINNPDEGGRP